MKLWCLIIMLAGLLPKLNIALETNQENLEEVECSTLINAVKFEELLYRSDQTACIEVFCLLLHQVIKVMTSLF